MCAQAKMSTGSSSNALIIQEEMLMSKTMPYFTSLPLPLSLALIYCFGPQPGIPAKATWASRLPLPRAPYHPHHHPPPTLLPSIFKKHLSESFFSSYLSPAAPPPGPPRPPPRGGGWTAVRGKKLSDKCFLKRDGSRVGGGWWCGW